jgi:hypothetical protein
MVREVIPYRVSTEPAARRSGRRPPARPLRRLGWLTGLAAGLCVLASSASAADFVLRSGERFEGEVIHATRNTLMVREAIGRIRQLSYNDLKSVEIATRDGNVVAGALLEWRDGGYEIAVGERRIRVADRTVVEETALERAAPQETAAQETAPLETAVEETALEETVVEEAAIAPASESASEDAQAVAETGPDASPEAESQADAQADAGTSPEAAAEAEAPEAVQTAQPATLPVLVVSNAEAPESAAEMVFKIELSQPASRSIFVVYGTFNRTATAGEDYQEERGSVELKPGDSGAVVRIRLIDDDVAEDEETFEVFVSADRKLTSIENKRATGTILNDDN